MASSTALLKIRIMCLRVELDELRLGPATRCAGAIAARAALVANVSRYRGPSAATTPSVAFPIKMLLEGVAKPVRNTTAPGLAQGFLQLGCDVVRKKS